MAPIQRTAQAVWSGDLRSGNGKISSTSGILKETPTALPLGLRTLQALIPKS